MEARGQGEGKGPTFGSLRAQRSRPAVTIFLLSAHQAAQGQAQAEREQRSNGKDSDATRSREGRLLRGPPAGGILQMRQRTVLLGGRAEDTFLWPVLWNDWGQRWEREDVNLTSPYAWEGDITCPLSTKRPCFLQKADGRWLTAFS